VTTPIGTHGAIDTRRDGGRVVDQTRARDLDGRLRQVPATGPTAALARLVERLRERPALPGAGSLRTTTRRVVPGEAGERVAVAGMHTRTMLNMLFAHVLRHDAIPRNPVAGTSQLRRTHPTPRALTIDQITAIRKSAAHRRSEPGIPGPKPDGQVRDVIEILLATAMRARPRLP
jgi:hypothetical protein